MGVREFGDRIPGADYRDRPGSYAVLNDPAGRIAVLRTPAGWFLPGGGAEPGETPEETLVREVREECGCSLRGVRPIGRAVQYVSARGEGFFAKRSSFFRATPGERDDVATPEVDHELVWLDRAEVMRRLTHESHAWAVSRAV